MLLMLNQHKKVSLHDLPIQMNLLVTAIVFTLFFTQKKKYIKKREQKNHLSKPSGFKGNGILVNIELGR